MLQRISKHMEQRKPSSRKRAGQPDHFGEHWLLLSVAFGEGSSGVDRFTVRRCDPAWEAWEVLWEIPRHVLVLLKDCGEKPHGGDAENQTWS